MQRESVKAGTVNNQAAAKKRDVLCWPTERKTLTQELSAFRPQHETLSEKKDRWFGAWEPEQPNPAKFIMEDKSGVGTGVHYPKFPEARSSLISNSNESASNPTGEGWLAKVMRIGFGIEF